LKKLHSRRKPILTFKPTMAYLNYLLRLVALFLTISNLARAETKEERYENIIHTLLQSIVSQNDIITKHYVEAFSELKENVKEIKESLKSLEQKMVRLEVDDVPAIKDDVASLTSSCEQTKAKIDKMEEKVGGGEVMIVSGEQAAGDENCIKVCAGTTGRDTDWYDSSTKRVYYDVDISDCDFITIPTVTTSLEGNGYIGMATGPASVYNASPTSFRVYIYSNDDPQNGRAEKWEWNVEWIAVGYTC